jgi:hypothetical protein
MTTTTTTTDLLPPPLLCVALCVCVCPVRRAVRRPVGVARVVVSDEPAWSGLTCVDWSGLEWTGMD